MKQRFWVGVFGIAILLAVLAIANVPLEQKNPYENGISKTEGIEKYKNDLRQITCYCGCEHTDLYNCYEEGMLEGCGLCMKEYELYLEMRDSRSIGEISSFIDEKYGVLNE